MQVENCLAMTIPSNNPATGKAARTRGRILEVASREASIHGIDALTLGPLAKMLSMSKSGLYAHFGSLEALQLAVVDAICARFREEVVDPAFACPRGVKRLQAIMDLWIAWSQHPDRPGGCQLISAAFDFDAPHGPVRDRVAHWIRIWIGVIEREVEKLNEMHPDVCLDPKESASTALGIYMAQHLEGHLLGDDEAGARARGRWNSLLAQARHP